MKELDLTVKDKKKGAKNQKDESDGWLDNEPQNGGDDGSVPIKNLDEQS